MVKTLYEDASTFKQLGRTVRSALHTGGNDDEDSQDDGGDAETLDDDMTKSTKWEGD